MIQFLKNLLKTNYPKVNIGDIFISKRFETKIKILYINKDNTEAKTQLLIDMHGEKLDSHDQAFNQPSFTVEELFNHFCLHEDE